MHVQVLIYVKVCASDNQCNFMIFSLSLSPPLGWVEMIMRQIDFDRMATRIRAEHERGGGSGEFQYTSLTVNPEVINNHDHATHTMSNYNKVFQNSVRFF